MHRAKNEACQNPPKGDAAVIRSHKGHDAGEIPVMIVLSAAV
jgi:hypothetical protein